MTSAKLSDRAGRLKRRKQFPEMYARLPLSVLMDKALTDADVRVYAGLAAVVWQGTTERESYQEISELAGVSERQARRSIKALVAAGLISAAPSNRRGSRGVFSLASPVFGQKQRAGVTTVVSSPSRGTRYASLGKEVA